MINSPVVDPSVWDTYSLVNKGKARAMFCRLSEDESSIILHKVIQVNEGYNDIIDTLDEQVVFWIVINFPYKTIGGGQRYKMVFITWVSDKLERSSQKQQVREKSTAVMFAGVLADKIVKTDGASKMQANDKDDMEIWNVLAFASKFEREAVDIESVKEVMHV